MVLTARLPPTLPEEAAVWTWSAVLSAETMATLALRGTETEATEVVVEEVTEEEEERLGDAKVGTETETLDVVVAEVALAMCPLPQLPQSAVAPDLGPRSAAAAEAKSTPEAAVAAEVEVEVIEEIEEIVNIIIELTEVRMVNSS